METQVGIASVPRLSTLGLTGLLNILQIVLDQRRHFRRLPICFSRILGPGEGKMKDLSWLLCLFENGKGFEQYPPLPFSIPDLPDGPSVRMFNRGYSWNALSPGELPGLAEK